MTRWIAAALAALALAAIAVAGCGDDEDEGATTTKGATTAAQDSGGVKLEQVAGGFEEPLYVTQPPGSEDLYVVERAGKVKIVRDGETVAEPFIDISDRVSTEVEQGLLSIAFAPDYEESGLVYGYYTDGEGNNNVVEFKRSAENPDRVEDGEPRNLLQMQDFAPNHNGGLVVFGPDEKLYIGTGDGGGSGDPRRNAQNQQSLLGKILRLDPAAEGAKPEVYAYGLRNPWRFDFDDESGTLVIADVGQSRFEEIDIVEQSQAQGANFGWSAFEGEVPFNQDQAATAGASIKPALTYGRDAGCSVTGGYVVHDPELSALEGRYVYSDFCAGQLRSFELDGTKAADDKPLGLEVPATSSFGIDQAGHIYAIGFEDGTIYRLVGG